MIEFLDKKSEEARIIKAEINPNNMRAQFNFFKEWKKKTADAIASAHLKPGFNPDHLAEYE